jgi:hypothetical protein
MCDRTDRLYQKLALVESRIDLAGDSGGDERVWIHACALPLGSGSEHTLACPVLAGNRPLMCRFGT